MSTTAQQIPKAGPVARLGPRPLPLHLAVLGSTWLTSRAAFPVLKKGSLPWRGGLAARGEALRKALEGIEDKAFLTALDAEAGARSKAFINGVLNYRRHPYHRTLEDPPTVWQAGTTRLLDYGATAPEGRNGRPVLFIPSLVNRAYVLDLTARNSLLRSLARQGLRPLLMDWGDPGPEERSFDLTDYVLKRLEPGLQQILGAIGGPVTVVGYCMGGLLALALAQRRARDVDRLVLLATPWDFHAEKEVEAGLLAAALPSMQAMVSSLGVMPVDALQCLFAGLDPSMILRKFVAFSRLDPTSPKADDFVALEDWINDGIPLAGPVATECLAGWYVENTPCLGRWTIGGRVVDPREISAETLVLVPGNDHIVPPASALALGRMLPSARTEVVELAAGHIGMVVGRGAPDLLYGPLARWLSGKSFS